MEGAARLLMKLEERTLKLSDCTCDEARAQMKSGGGEEEKRRRRRGGENRREESEVILSLC